MAERRVGLAWAAGLGWLLRVVVWGDWLAGWSGVEGVLIRGMQLFGIKVLSSVLLFSDS